jgi:acyl-CoA thioester hydrolase
MIEHSYPFRSSTMTVEPAWIDYNGHLNMAYYNVLFDRAVDEAASDLGLGPDYVRHHQASFYTAEAHIRYLREIHAGDPVFCLVRLIAADEKRLHWWQELWRTGDQVLSATSEQIALHVDMTARKVSPFPAGITARIAQWRMRDARLPKPEGAGRRVRISGKR